MNSIPMNFARSGGLQFSSKQSSEVVAAKKIGEQIRTDYECNSTKRDPDLLRQLADQSRTSTAAQKTMMEMLADAGPLGKDASIAMRNVLEDAKLLKETRASIHEAAFVWFIQSSEHAYAAAPVFLLNLASLHARGDLASRREEAQRLETIVRRRLDPNMILQGDRDLLSYGRAVCQDEMNSAAEVLQRRGVLFNQSTPYSKPRDVIFFQPCETGSPQDVEFRQSLNGTLSGLPAKEFRPIQINLSGHYVSGFSFLDTNNKICLTLLDTAPTRALNSLEAVLKNCGLRVGIHAERLQRDDYLTNGCGPLQMLMMDYCMKQSHQSPHDAIRNFVQDFMALSPEAKMSRMNGVRGDLLEAWIDKIPLEFKIQQLANDAIVGDNSAFDRLAGELSALDPEKFSAALAQITASDGEGQTAYAKLVDSMQLHFTNRSEFESHLKSFQKRNFEDAVEFLEYWSNAKTDIRAKFYAERTGKKLFALDAHSRNTLCEQIDSILKSSPRKEEIIKYVSAAYGWSDAKVISKDHGSDTNKEEEADLDDQLEELVVNALTLDDFEKMTRSSRKSTPVEQADDNGVVDWSNAPDLDAIENAHLPDGKSGELSALKIKPAKDFQARMTQGDRIKNIFGLNADPLEEFETNKLTLKVDLAEKRSTGKVG